MTCCFKTQLALVPPTMEAAMSTLNAQICPISLAAGNANATMVGTAMASLARVSVCVGGGGGCLFC